MLFDSEPKIKKLETKKQLSDRELSILLFNSYKFSQGVPGIQVQILHRAVEYYGLQEIDPERLKRLVVIFITIFMKEVSVPESNDVSTEGPKESQFVFNIEEKGIHKESNPKKEREMLKELKKYVEILNGKFNEEVMVFNALLSWFIFRDLFYLEPKNVGRKGGNKSNNPEDKNTVKDKRISYFREYIYLRKKIGEPFFDALFSKFSDTVKNDSFLNEEPKKYRILSKLSSFKSNKECLLSLFICYNLFHPETTMDFEAFIGNK